MAPPGITFTKTLIFDPGCDVFWCAGGALYKLDEATLNSIRSDGETYLNGLGHTNKNSRSIGTWSFSEIDTKRPSEKHVYEYPRIWFGNQRRKDKALIEFRESLRKDGYYISSRRSEPLLIISPKTGIMYMGWFD